MSKLPSPHSFTTRQYLLYFLPQMIIRHIVIGFIAVGIAEGIIPCRGEVLEIGEKAADEFSNGTGIELAPG